ncbi:hypothetical protein G6F59_017710 [Rhizopus arrhizus]|nr:hypothetical protein G6F59_017710 [Rhizopus arrhizus]
MARSSLKLAALRSLLLCRLCGRRKETHAPAPLRQPDVRTPRVGRPGPARDAGRPRRDGQPDQLGGPGRPSGPATAGGCRGAPAAGRTQRAPLARATGRCLPGDAGAPG